jgi:hypothetical protein
MPDPSGLDPTFQQKLSDFQDYLRANYNLDTRIGSGFRDPAVQDQLYAQGRTAPGPIFTNAPAGSSYHNYGAAADLQPVGMSEKDAETILRQAVAANPQSGLTWGGSFKSLYDPFHFQLGVPLAQLRAGQPQQSAILPIPPASAPVLAPGGGGGVTAPLGTTSLAPDAAPSPSPQGGRSIWDQMPAAAPQSQMSFLQLPQARPSAKTMAALRAMFQKRG